MQTYDIKMPKSLSIKFAGPNSQKKKEKKTMKNYSRLTYVLLDLGKPHN